MISANSLQHAILVLDQRLRPVFDRPERWLQVAVRLVMVLLALALAHAVASLAWSVFLGRATLPVKPLPAATSANASGGAALDYAAIGDWHLFGRADPPRSAAPSAPPVPPPPPPMTPLNLRLVGLFFAEQGANAALALIAEGDGAESAYRIGAALPGGARLERIERDQVVVSRQGHQETLRLPRLDEAGTLTNSRPASAPKLLNRAPAPSPDEAAPDATGPVIDASAIADRLRGEIGARPQALQDVAFASPYLRDGQFIGFRLRPGRDRQLFQQLGLSGGDVLVEVNGTRLNSPSQGLALLQELMSAERLELRILRNGSEIPLTFSLSGAPPVR